MPDDTLTLTMQVDGTEEFNRHFDSMEEAVSASASSMQVETDKLGKSWEEMHAQANESAEGVRELFTETEGATENWHEVAEASLQYADALREVRAAQEAAVGNNSEENLDRLAAAMRRASEASHELHEAQQKTGESGGLLGKVFESVGYKLESGVGIPLREIGVRFGEFKEALGGAEGLMLAMGAAAAATAGVMYELGEAFVENAKQIQVQAEIMGLTTDLYQAVGLAAEHAGMSAEGARYGFMMLSREIAQANEGNTSAIDKLDRLGIAGMNTSQAIEHLVGSLGNEATAELTADRIRETLGMRGIRLLPVLREMAEEHERTGKSVAEMTEELKKADLILGKDTIESTAAAHKVIDNLGDEFKILKHELGEAFTPVAAAGAALLTDVLEILRDVVKGTGTAIVFLAEQVQTFYDLISHPASFEWWSDLKESWQEVTESFGGMASRAETVLGIESSKAKMAASANREHAGALKELAEAQTAVSRAATPADRTAALEREQAAQARVQETQEALNKAQGEGAGAEKANAATREYGAALEALQATQQKLASASPGERAGLIQQQIADTERLAEATQKKAEVERAAATAKVTQGPVSYEGFLGEKLKQDASKGAEVLREQKEQLEQAKFQAGESAAAVAAATEPIYRTQLAQETEFISRSQATLKDLKAEMEGAAGETRKSLEDRYKQVQAELVKGEGQALKTRKELSGVVVGAAAPGEAEELARLEAKKRTDEAEYARRESELKNAVKLHQISEEEELRETQRINAEKTASDIAYEKAKEAIEVRKAGLEHRPTEPIREKYEGIITAETIKGERENAASEAAILESRITLAQTIARQNIELQKSEASEQVAATAFAAKQEFDDRKLSAEQYRSLLMDEAKQRTEIERTALEQELTLAELQGDKGKAAAEKLTSEIRDLKFKGALDAAKAEEQGNKIVEEEQHRRLEIESTAETDAAKHRFEMTHTELDRELSQHRITLSEWRDDTLRATAEEVEVRRHAIEEEMALLRTQGKEGTEAYQQQIEKMKQLNRELETSNRQTWNKYADDERKGLSQALADFNASVTEMERSGNIFERDFAKIWRQIAEQGTIDIQRLTNEMNQGLARMMVEHKNFAQVVKQLWQQLAQSAIEAVLKIVETYIINKTRQIVLDKVFHTQEIAQTTATATAQTTAVAAAQTAQTAAVTGALATQTAAITSNSVIQQGIIKAAALAAVSAEAGVAAAAQFADVMETVPFPANLSVAPAMAAAAFGQAMAFGSAEKGALLSKETFMQLHPKEMVLPEHIATPLQEMLATQPAAAERKGSLEGEGKPPQESREMTLPDHIAMPLQEMLATSSGRTGSAEHGALVEEEMMMRVHPHEMVLPGKIAGPLEEALNPRAAAAGGGGTTLSSLMSTISNNNRTQNMRMNYAPTIHGGGADTRKMLKDHSRDVAAAVRREIRKGSIHTY